MEAFPGLALGERSTCRQTLWQWVKLDVLKPGDHFIKRAPGVKSPMWWNIAAVREAIRQYNVDLVETYQLD